MNNKAIIFYTSIIGAIILGGLFTIFDDYLRPPYGGYIQELSIEQDGIEKVLKDKTLKEKANIKSIELANVKIGKFTKDDIEIEIIGDIEKIEGGIQLFAKAWKDGKQLGFGKDGSVEIERFRFFNPPILVDDVNGDIVREWEAKNIETGIKETKQRKLKYDPDEVIKRILEQTVELVGKENTKIIIGKIGYTTSIFYPAAGANSPVDGRLNETGTSWADNRAAEEAGSVGVTTSNDVIVQSEYTAVNKPISRCAFCFNTAALSTEDISSATLSIYSSKNGNNSETKYPADLAVVSVDLDSTDDLIAADYAIANWGSTRFTASDYDLGTFIASVGYKNFTLNSAGVLNILKTGVSQFGIRAASDIDNNTPTAGRSYGLGYYADETGTAKDPKLVVEHEAAPEPDHGSQPVIWFK